MLFKHIFLWVAIIFGMTVAIPLITTPEKMWENVRTELGMIESAFGTEDATAITRQATSIYKVMFIETGVVDATGAVKVSREEQAIGEAVLGTPSRALTGVTNNYLDTLSALVYVLTLRTLILLSWAPFVMPFLLGAFGEGYARRQIKFATFGQYGAAVYAGAMHMSVIIAVLPLLYLIVPFPFTPYFVPFWALTAAIPIIVSIANAAQILPR